MEALNVYFDQHTAQYVHERRNEDDIEYVRKDAFIEKALTYLNEKFYFSNYHYSVENNTFNCMEEMFEDFRKYMEGE